MRGLLLTLVAVSVVGCSFINDPAARYTFDDDLDGGRDPSDSGTDAGPDDPSADAGPPDLCAGTSIAGRGCQRVPCEGGQIDRNVTLSSSTPWVLDEQCIVINSTLTLRPGAQIYAQAGSALVIATTARLEAVGNSTNPIVFTSYNEVVSGTASRAGDWGGVVLLGEAQVNLDQDVVGLVSNGNLTEFGGSDDTHNCGRLEYVRIEFAGEDLTGGDNGLNGLTVAACGTDTTLDHIQVRYVQDDGIEMLGGTAGLRHAVVLGSNDDAFDFDLGYRGDLQFLLCVQLGERLSPRLRGPLREQRCFEVNGGFVDDSPVLRTPRTQFRMYNVTAAGPGFDDVDRTEAGEGVLLREGATGELTNLLAFDFTSPCIALQGEETLNSTLDLGTPFIDVALLWACGGAAGRQFTLYDPAGCSCESVVMELEAEEDSSRLVTGTNPGLTFDRDDLAEDSFVPPLGSEAAMVTGIAPPPGFDRDATYVGAFEPGTGSPWTDGWTRFE